MTAEVVAPEIASPVVVVPTVFGDLGVGVREGIVAAMRVARLGVDGSLVLEDRVERIVATVAASGTVVEGRDGARVGFSGARLGRDGGLVELRGGVPVGVDTSTVSLDRVAGGVAVREWWRHGGLGIEQGFTVGSRPGGTGLLRVQQRVSSSLTAEVVDGGLGLRFVDGGGGERLRFGGLVAFDAVGRGLVAVMVVDGDVVSFVVDDRDAVFPVGIDPVWSQQVYLKASNTDAGDEFGLSVAVSGDTVVVGARYEDSDATGVDGDQTNNASSSAGAAYVFTRTGVLWSQQAYLKASNTDAGDEFGTSVSVSGDTVVVGPPLRGQQRHRGKQLGTGWS